MLMSINSPQVERIIITYLSLLYFANFLTMQQTKHVLQLTSLNDKCILNCHLLTFAHLLLKIHRNISPS